MVPPTLVPWLRHWTVVERCNLRFFSVQAYTAKVDVDDIAFSCSLFSDKVDNRDGLNQLQMDAFGCMVQGSFLTYMYLCPKVC